MYKVDYCTFWRFKDGSIGNVVQFHNTYFTENKIENIPNELQRAVDIIYNNRYTVDIKHIEAIQGHGER